MRRFFTALFLMLILPFVLVGDDAFSLDLGIGLENIPNDPLVHRGMWEGPGGRSMRSEQYDWYNFHARGYLSNRPENSVCLRRIANGNADFLMGSDDPSRTWQFNAPGLGSITLPPLPGAFNFRYIDFAKRECGSSISGEWWPDRFDLCDEDVGWKRANHMRVRKLYTGDPCYHIQAGCTTPFPARAAMHLPSPLSMTNLGTIAMPDVEDFRAGDETHIMSIFGRIDFSGVNFRYPAAHCANEFSDLLGDRSWQRMTKQKEERGRIWYVDPIGNIDSLYWSNSGSVKGRNDYYDPNGDNYVSASCCAVKDPYGVFKDGPQSSDEYLFKKDWLASDPEYLGQPTPREFVQFSGAPNEYGHNWCEYELPYRPHADNVLPNVSAPNVGFPPTLPVMLYTIQWNKWKLASIPTPPPGVENVPGLSDAITNPPSPDDPDNDLQGGLGKMASLAGKALSGIRFDRLLRDEGPKELAVQTSRLSTNFKMVERIRETCSAFGPRQLRDEESPRKKKVARFFGYRNLCDKWRGLYDRLHDEIDVLQYRLERYNYEFLRSFLDCTGPFIDAPWACTKVEFQCRKDWKFCPGGNLASALNVDDLLNQVGLGKVAELKNKLTDEQFRDIMQKIKDPKTLQEVLDKVGLDKVADLLLKYEQKITDLINEFTTVDTTKLTEFMDKIENSDFYRDLQDMKKTAEVLKDDLSRLKLLNVIDNLLPGDQTAIAKLLNDNDAQTLIGFLQNPSLNPKDIKKALKAGKSKTNDIEDCIAIQCWKDCTSTGLCPGKPCSGSDTCDPAGFCLDSFGDEYCPGSSGAFLDVPSLFSVAMKREWDFISKAYAQQRPGTAAERWDGKPENQPVCAAILLPLIKPPLGWPIGVSPKTHPLPIPPFIPLPDPTASWCDCWKCVHTQRANAYSGVEEPSLERRQRMGQLGPGVPYVTCLAEFPVIGGCFLWRTPNVLRTLPTEEMVQLPPPYNLAAGDFVDDAQNAVNCCEPRFDKVVPTPLPKGRFWCHCNDDIAQTWKCNENWCTCQQSLKETGFGKATDMPPKVESCEHPADLNPPGSAPFPEKYYVPPVALNMISPFASILGGVFGTNLTKYLDITNTLPFMPNVLPPLPVPIPFGDGSMQVPLGLMYANLGTKGCPIPYTTDIDLSKIPLIGPKIGKVPISVIIKEVQNYVGVPSQCDPTYQYDRWLACFHKARADANVILEREVSTGITPSTTIYESDEFAAAGRPKGTNLRWTGFESNILARLPIKPVDTHITGQAGINAGIDTHDSDLGTFNNNNKDWGIKGDPGAIANDQTAYKHHDLTLFSQTHSTRFPYMEAVIPYPFATHLPSGVSATDPNSPAKFAEAVAEQGNQSVAATIRDEYGRKMRTDATHQPTVRESDKVMTERGPSQRATEAIVGARGCDIGGWYELMLYQARCIKLFRLNCICDYGKTFVEGSSEAYVLRRGGAVFNTRKYDPTTKQTQSIKLVWPLMWRGYAGPEYARRFSNPESKLWMRAQGLAAAASHTGVAVAPYTYKGLNCAEPGDIIIWDEQLRNQDGSDARSRRHVAYVEATTFTNDDEAKPCDIRPEKMDPLPPLPGGSTWCPDPNVPCPAALAPILFEASTAKNPAVIVTEWNWGKNQDACGNTNRWKALTVRTIFKNPTKPDTKSKNQPEPLVATAVGGALELIGKENYGLCSDADNAKCWEPNWERLKVYRPRADHYPKAAAYTSIASDGLYGQGQNSIYSPDPDPKRQGGYIRTQIVDPNDPKKTTAKFKLPAPPAQPFYPPPTGGDATLARPICASPEPISYCSLLTANPQVACNSMKLLKDTATGAALTKLSCPDPANPGAFRDFDLASLTPPAPTAEDWKCSQIGFYDYDVVLPALRQRIGLCEPPFELRGTEMPPRMQIANLAKSGQKERTRFLPNVIGGIFQLVGVNAPDGIPYLGLSEYIQNQLLTLKLSNFIPPYPWSVPAPVNSGNEPRYYNVAKTGTPPGAGSSSSSSSSSSGGTPPAEPNCQVECQGSYECKVCTQDRNCYKGDTCDVAKGYCVKGSGEKYCAKGCCTPGSCGSGAICYDPYTPQYSSPMTLVRSYNNELPVCVQLVAPRNCVDSNSGYILCSGTTACPSGTCSSSISGCLCPSGTPIPTAFCP